MEHPTTLLDRLRRHRAEIAPVLPAALLATPPLVLDFSAANHELAGVDVADAAELAAWIEDRLAAVGAGFGLGRYDEDRVLYRHSPLFDDELERRSLHLGIDLFAPAGTAVHAPLTGSVHSLADNAGVGDYGPTVILEHELEGRSFWTLYGHLHRDVLEALRPGAVVAAGEAFAALGDSYVNGGWPPHLHLQLIADLGDHRGDFPGVAAPSERARWLERCPDPTVLLQGTAGSTEARR
jgi:murein DD-endopeptidase MepM/ murein hydrolase activator NlpD